MRTSIVRALPIAIFAIVLPLKALAGPCYLNDDNKVGSSLSTPLHTNTTVGAGAMNHIICGQSIVGAGCELILDDDATGVGGQNCLHIGRGVQITGNSHTFTCSQAQSPCGTAIVVQEPSGAGTGTTQVLDLNIVGGWTIGTTNGHPTTASNATSLTVDLYDPDTTNVQATAGISGFKTVTSSFITNVAFGPGVVLQGSGTLKSSIVKNSQVGIQTTSTSNSVENSLLVDNGVNINHPTYSILDSKGSVFNTPTTCECSQYAAPGSCLAAISNCLTYSGTNQSFVESEIP